jgi:hypothetical protein
VKRHGRGSEVARRTSGCCVFVSPGVGVGIMAVHVALGLGLVVNSAGWNGEWGGRGEGDRERGTGQGARQPLERMFFGPCELVSVLYLLSGSTSC